MLFASAMHNFTNTILHCSCNGKQQGESRGKARFAPKWTDTEKAQFLTLVPRYGKDWVTMAQIIRTKTSSQIRNYFQNYKNRLGNACLFVCLPTYSLYSATRYCRHCMCSASREGFALYRQATYHPLCIRALSFVVLEAQCQSLHICSCKLARVLYSACHSLSAHKSHTTTLCKILFCDDPTSHCQAWKTCSRLSTMSLLTAQQQQQQVTRLQVTRHKLNSSVLSCHRGSSWTQRPLQQQQQWQQ
jgi:Myb-like DNA-binding domain